MPGFVLHRESDPINSFVPGILESDKRNNPQGYAARG